MDTKGLQKEFINWCKSKNKLPKSEDETKQLFIAFMKEKHPEEYKAAMENQLKQATKALHGAKLNYFKSLKHQCAEDEEVVYYKKGGSVTCGCKKKENGGEVKKNCGGSAISNFKMRKGLNGMEVPTERKTATKQPKPQKVKIYWTDLDDRKLDSLVTRKEIQKKPLTEQGEKDLKNLREKFKKAANKDQYEVDASEQPSKKCGGKVKKKAKGSKINKDCDGAVAKFKALRKGGSLNGIPFMLTGTSNRGIHLNEWKEKQFDPLPLNLTKEEFINRYKMYGVPRNFFELDQDTKRNIFMKAYSQYLKSQLPDSTKIIIPSELLKEPQFNIDTTLVLPPVLFDLNRVGKFGDGDKLPTARKAEERYANSTFLTTEHPLFSTSMRFNPKAYHEGILQIKPAWNYRPAWITMEVSGNDTTYRERPEQKMGFNKTVIRQASNSDSDKSEYRTLLRRFNIAKGIAKQPKAKEETKSAPVSFTSFLKHMIPGLK